MGHVFKVSDRVVVAPEAYTRAGNSGVITLIYRDFACVMFDDGDETAYLLEDNELLLQESVPSMTTAERVKVDP